MRTKLKNVRTGAVLERTYRADEKLQQAIVEKREMQYLYREGEQYVFMDTSTYDQLHVEAATLGNATRWLKEGDSAVVQTYKTGYLRGGNRNPIQRAKRWWVLHTNPVLRAAVEKPDR